MNIPMKPHQIAELLAVLRAAGVAKFHTPELQLELYPGPYDYDEAHTSAQPDAELDPPKLEFKVYDDIMEDPEMYPDGEVPGFTGFDVTKHRKND